jgi:hypothetical protein
MDSCDILFCVFRMTSAALLACAKLNRFLAFLLLHLGDDGMMELYPDGLPGRILLMVRSCCTAAQHFN